jgi:hypothetical protein
MKRLKKILLFVISGLFGVFLILQFFRPEMNNPPFNPDDTIEAKLQVSPQVKEIFARSCNDCHSNQTVWPWYSNVAPMSWKMAEHINDGRKEVNFSTWAQYDTKQQERKLDKICDQITDGEMPEWSYTLIHWNAKLSEADKKLICEWTEQERARLKQR